MTVYIEYVILDNFIFTALICYLSYNILREKVRRFRCVAASTVGTACAIIYPFIKNAAFVIIFKVALYIVMCLILYVKLPNFFKRALSFLLATALIGGVQFMIGFIVHGNASAALRLPISELPISIFFIPPILMFFVCKQVLSKINAHRLKQNYIYDIKLTVGDKSLKLRGLLDTGNNVRAGRDVVFVNKLIALDLLGGEYLTFMSGDKAVSSTVVHTASGSKKIILLPGTIE
ncbi:MAG: sigma-E processing peptidase SpoIIGA, partial [Clostridiales bacterium]|nr:sigma-E processing peptidase SpoIIGA [Clostridiales bacterium]